VSGQVESAFVLGAGLGTRLGLLTSDRPKPLVPVFGKPIIAFAFDHLIAAGIRQFVVNTHHRAGAYEADFPATDGRSSYRERPVTFRHEPLLLETGGGIKNVQDLLGGGDFLVHNGDVLADLDLKKLIFAHAGSGRVATLGLRSSGGPTQIAFDETAGLVTDIRGALGKPASKQCLFTGIYMVSPSLFDFLPAGKPVSVITALLEAMCDGREIGGVLLDEGAWFDLGTVEAYKAIHGLIAGGLRFSHTPDDNWPQLVAADATVGIGSRMSGMTTLGSGSEVGEGCELEDCILWPGAKTASRLRLKDCIVRTFANQSAEHQIL
jgi:NDP-sugar pyrophosphorylase family protein